MNFVSRGLRPHGLLFLLIFGSLLFLLLSTVANAGGSTGEGASGTGKSKAGKGKGTVKHDSNRAKSNWKKLTASAKKSKPPAKSQNDREKDEHEFVNKLNKKNGGKWKAEFNKQYALLSDLGNKRFFGGARLKGRSGGSHPPSKSGTPSASRHHSPSRKGSGSAAKKAVHGSKGGGKDRRRKKRAPDPPATFDARTHWPQCSHFIGRLSDQSACGACWAVATADMLTDRLCIAQVRTGKQHYTDVHFGVSAADLLSCSGAGNCDSGVVANAVDYAVTSRVVSGSGYALVAKTYCMPFPFPPLRRFTGTVEWIKFTAPACTPKDNDKCTNGNYRRSYSEDKQILGAHNDGFHLKLRSHHLANMQATVERIQNAIMNGGPVVTTLNAYRDLKYYKGGIYEKTEIPENTFIFTHAVRIIGWGHENDTEYWLCANTVNRAWGENGFFRIIRGRNECGIEQNSIDYMEFTDPPAACTGQHCVIQ